MKRKKTYRVALTGILFALAIVLSLAESWLTPLLGLPPGVKIGLANIVVMYALLFVSVKEAGLLVLLKAGFAFLIRGFMAGLLSLSGGLLSLLVMWLLMKTKKRPSVLILSIAGSLSHNFAQMVVVVLLLGRHSLVYAPVLLVSGIIMGILTAILLRVAIPALVKTGQFDKR